MAPPSALSNDSSSPAASHAALQRTPAVAPPNTTQRSIIIFSDFDGTIFHQDTGHLLFDAHGCGAARREQLDAEISAGTRSFRDVSEELWSSLSLPFDDAFTTMGPGLSLDPGFRDFHQYCITHAIPFNVISAGLKPLLRRVLDEFLGPKDSKHIDIIANDVRMQDGTWKPVWRHNNSLGHDKAASIQEYRTIASSESADGSCPLIVFIGDGVSDLAAAREADVLFARRGLRLEEYCIENGIKHISFDTFTDIQRDVEKLMKDDTGRGKPAVYNPKANFWRKVGGRKGAGRLVGKATEGEKVEFWTETFAPVVEGKVEPKEAVAA